MANGLAGDEVLVLPGDTQSAGAAEQTAAGDDDRPGVGSDDTRASDGGALTAADAGATALDAGAMPGAGNAADASAQPEPGPRGDSGDTVTMEDDDDDSGLRRLLQALAAADPRARQAAALQNLLQSFAQGDGTPEASAVIDVVDAIDCWDNARTCIALCAWAASNCGECANDAACVERLEQSCNRTCQ